MGRRAKRSLRRYMSDSSNFLPLQAFIETLSIFQGNGMDVNCLLPPSCYYIKSDLDCLPREFTISNYEYHTCLSSITRQLIKNELKEDQVEIFELTEEKFIKSCLPIGNDLFLYYCRREHSFNHLLVFGPHKIYMETIDPKTMSIDESKLCVKTDCWEFTFSNISYVITLFDKNETKESAKSPSKSIVRQEVLHDIC